MEKELGALETAVQSNEELGSRRVWEKPEAKAAEVAHVTLAGGTTHSTADLGVCSS